jgi:ATP-dependent exoDNAse (exonuclease V) beta subunit
MSEFRWTPEQVRVLLDRENGLLAASAGTGKTRTIVGKIGWLLGIDVGPGPDGLPIPPPPAPCSLDQIAAITFTEKAASELKDRLRHIVEGSDRAAELRWELDRASVGTIHGFCAGLLREHALRLDIDPTFRVLDDREATLRLHEIIRAVVLRAVEEGGDAIGNLLDRFQLYDGNYRTGLVGVVDSAVRDLRWHAHAYDDWVIDRSSAAEPAALDLDRLREIAAERLSGAVMDAGDEAALELADALYGLAHRAVANWLRWMEEENVRDFDSLILDARRLLTRPEHRPALESIRAGLRILIIDEFQDTDAAQRDIAFALAGIGDPDPGPVPQLLVVGDPKQSIYGFRGADVRVWNDVRRRLCGDRPPMRLTENFRSQPGLVEFINEVAEAAIENAGDALKEHDRDLYIPYTPLQAYRSEAPGQGVDWLDCTVEGGTRSDRAALEARLVASRVRSLLDGEKLRDPRTLELRGVEARDIAILARTRRALDEVDEALREAGIRVYNAARLGLSNRAEVLDLVTTLRLLADPEDDYHACAWLRSPLVGLRDEAVVRFRLDRAARPGALLRQARRHLERCESGDASWFEAPEHPEVAGIEREALSRGLDALAEGQALVDRAPASELLEDIVRRTGYRLHLLLRPGAEESLAAMERFSALLDEYRHLPVGTFLALWDRWGDQDLGIPQAPLFSAADDVVTLQTIHTAKGLEWPIVFLLRAGDGSTDRLKDSYVSDPRLGPALLPKASERGARAGAIAERVLAAERAEESRLLYVALTRAADRIVVSAHDVDAGYMEFLRPALRDAVPPHLVAADGGPRAGRKAARAARVDDPASRTGSQIEVFDPDGTGQMDLFLNRRPGGEPPEAAEGLRRVVYRTPDPRQGSLTPLPVTLDWLDALVPGPVDGLARPIEVPTERPVTSATELQLRAADPAAWRLRYVHAVEEAWRFAPTGAATGIPSTLRGTLIHGVLERIRAIDDLADVLDETIAGLDAPPGVEEQLRPGAEYRLALETEIARVVKGEEWQWYVEGEHSRELRFLVLDTPGPWITGALDLYRATPEPWVIDFKTHRIGAAEIPAVAEEYRIQADVYRGAVAALSGRAPGVRLHFTHPNVATELSRPRD